VPFLRNSPNQKTERREQHTVAEEPTQNAPRSQGDNGHTQVEKETNASVQRQGPTIAEPSHISYLLIVIDSLHNLKLPSHCKRQGERWLLLPCDHTAGVGRGGMLDGCGPCVRRVDALSKG
jgi:hypothetical protein